MSMNIPKQDAFFYKGSWSAEVDDKLLSAIIRLRRRDPWIGDVIPGWAIIEASDLFYRELGSNFTLTEIHQRVKLLERRFRTFKEILDTPDIIWDLSHKIIRANDVVWNKIFQVHFPLFNT